MSDYKKIFEDSTKTSSTFKWTEKPLSATEIRSMYKDIRGILHGIYIVAIFLIIIEVVF